MSQLVGDFLIERLHEASQEIPDGHYAQFAEMYGLRGIFVDTPDQIGKSWDEALHADRPVVLEATTDPEVPPLPPHVTFDQAKQLMPRWLRATLTRDAS